MPAEKIAVVIEDAIRHLHQIGLTVCNAHEFLNSNINKLLTALCELPHKPCIDKMYSSISKGTGSSV